MKQNIFWPKNWKESHTDKYMRRGMIIGATAGFASGSLIGVIGGSMIGSGIGTILGSKKDRRGK